MLSQKHTNKYSKYTLEDFLMDDFFIQSIKNPSEESENFWSEFILNNPQNIEEFVQAKEILLSIKDDGDLMLSDSEINEMWDNIMEINHTIPKKKNSTFKYWIGAAASIAACIIAAVLLFDNSGRLEVKPEGILTHVEQNKTVNLNDTTVRLIISDQKILTTKEAEPMIAYDSEEIVLSTHEISKTESAEYNQLIVPYGKRSRLTLSDGTKIWVNAGTTLTYPVEFSKNRREIYVNGEVFLDVTPDTDRPFIVKTNNFDIRVLGTKFNVSTYENEVNNVVLASGSVKITESHNKQDIILKPSEMFELSNGQFLKKRVNIEYYISWKDGLYLFENERLDVIMKRLSKYYGKSIDCNPNIGSLRCSGKLDLKDNLKDILDNLSTISSMKYTIDGNNYHVY